MSPPPGCDNNDIDGGSYSRCLDQVETGICEGCGNQFEVGELDEIKEIDPDLHWCETCRLKCDVCGHVLGVHALQVDEHLVRDGCDGNHGEPGECQCLGFTAKVPAAIVVLAKGIMTDGGETGEK